MKRFLILLCLLSLLLSGCSLRNRGVSLSPACRVSAMEVLSVTDQYLDNKLSAVLAAGRINDLCLSLSITPPEPGASNQLVVSACDTINHTIMLIVEGYQIDHTELLTARNSLAYLLGQKTRNK